jgi:GH35 family endo-1,4-beta-xylanase
MDPLGAKPSIVDVDTLTMWGETDVPSYLTASKETAQMEKKSKFVFDKNINNKIAFW